MRYIRRIMLGLFACFMLANPVGADSVTIPNTFTSGTPAVAAEVNANFDAVANAINGNDTAIQNHGADTNAHHSRYTNVEAVAALESAGRFQTKYVRTVVVSPMGTASENGTQLAFSLASITDAAADKPYVLKIEPGIYDIGQNYLAMKEYVDIEGSGRQLTRITSSQIVLSQATVVLASNAELRNLTLENLTAGQANGVIATDLAGARMKDVTINVSAASRARGLYVIRSSIELNSVKVNASTSNSSINCDAMYLINSIGNIYNTSSICTGGSRTTGLFFYNSDVDVRNVLARAEGGQLNIGLQTMTSALQPVYKVRIYNSQIDGVDYSVRAEGSFNVYIGASQLDGGNTFTGIGSLTCVGVFDENFVNAGGYNACP